MLVYHGAKDQPNFSETVEFSYMVHDQRFYIVEQVNSSSIQEQEDSSQIPLGNKYDYERVWICE